MQTLACGKTRQVKIDTDGPFTISANYSRAGMWRSALLKYVVKGCEEE